MYSVFSQVLHRHVSLSDGFGYVTQKGFNLQNVTKLIFSRLSALYCKCRLQRKSRNTRLCFLILHLVIVLFLPEVSVETSSLSKNVWTDSLSLLERQPFFLRVWFLYGEHPIREPAKFLNRYLRRISPLTMSCVMYWSFALFVISFNLLNQRKVKFKCFANSLLAVCVLCGFSQQFSRLWPWSAIRCLSKSAQPLLI